MRQQGGELRPQRLLGFHAHGHTTPWPGISVSVKLI
jgi:hypothetical protein